MAKALTFEQFIDYAKKHYERGGDSFVECWEEKDFDWYVKQFGAVTKREALKMFRENYDHEKDVAGYWRY